MFKCLNFRIFDVFLVFLFVPIAGILIRVSLIYLVFLTVSQKAYPEIPEDETQNFAKLRTTTAGPNVNQIGGIQNTEQIKGANEEDERNPGEDEFNIFRFVSRTWSNLFISKFKRDQSYEEV